MNLFTLIYYLYFNLLSHSYLTPMALIWHSYETPMTFLGNKFPLKNSSTHISKTNTILANIFFWNSGFYGKQTLLI